MKKNMNILGAIAIVLMAGFVIAGCKNSTDPATTTTSTAVPAGLRFVWQNNSDADAIEFTATNKFKALLASLEFHASVSGKVVTLDNDSTGKFEYALTDSIIANDTLTISNGEGAGMAFHGTYTRPTLPAKLKGVWEDDAAAIADITFTNRTFSDGTTTWDASEASGVVTLKTTGTQTEAGTFAVALSTVSTADDTLTISAGTDAASALNATYTLKP